MVGWIPCGPRSRRRNPTVCSTSAIALETEGCEIARSVAALPMLPDFATASRMCRSRNLSRLPKQSVVVENRPGADTMLGTQAFRDARDDHVLLFTTHSTFTVMPLLHAKVPYDPIGDVKPISLVVEDFLGVVVTPKLEIGSLSEL